MTPYQTIAIVKIFAGKVGMNEGQAKLRAHNVKLVEGEKNIYEVLAPLTFKAGEIIGLEEVKDKATLAKLVELDTKTGKPKVQPKPKSKKATKKATQKDGE